MDNYGQLRIYVSKKYFPIFHEMTRSKLFTQNSEFFVLCAFIGEKNNTRIPLENRHELCRAVTLSTYDHTALKALYLKRNESLSNVKDIIELAEEYANAGIKYILENVFNDIILVDEEGKYVFKPGLGQEIQMKMFNYVLTDKEEVPF